MVLSSVEEMRSKGHVIGLLERRICQISFVERKKMCYNDEIGGMKGKNRGLRKRLADLINVLFNKVPSWRKRK